MEIKILQVFLGADGLPYKDQERTVHFPIVGSGFQGASNTTKIRFYYDELVEEDDTETAWVACAKLPNGKIGSKVLETDYDNTLGEHYALLELDSFYFQYKGDVYISLQGYQGGVQVSYDEETELYTINGTPTIAATGSIKLSVNYATQFVGSGETSNVNFQRILADLGTKLGIRATSVYVEELPTVGNPDTFYVINNDLSDPNKANIYIWNSITEHYVWVGDNTLDLGDYYTAEQAEQFEEEVNDTIDELNDRIDDLGTALNFKGTKTVAQINALTGQETGDVYSVSDSGTLSAGSISVSAGDNVAWTSGNVWDKLAGNINLTNYLQKSEVDSSILDNSDNPVKNKSLFTALNCEYDYIKTGSYGNSNFPSGFGNTASGYGVSLNKSSLKGNIIGIKSKLIFKNTETVFPRIIRVIIAKSPQTDATQNYGTISFANNSGNVIFEKEITVTSNPFDVDVNLDIDISLITTDVFLVIFKDKSDEQIGLCIANVSTPLLVNGGGYSNYGADNLSMLGTAYSGWYNKYIELKYTKVGVAKIEDLDGCVKKEEVGLEKVDNPNIWNIKEQVYGSYARPDNGNIEYYPTNQYIQNYMRSGYIPVEPNTHYTLSFFGTLTGAYGYIYIAYYGKDKSFVTGSQLNGSGSQPITNISFVSPNNINIEYAIISVSTQVIQPMQLEEGDTATPYQVYDGDKYKMTNLVVDIDQIKESKNYISVPNELYAVVDDTFEMFHKGILNLKSYENMYVECLCDIGYNYQRKFVCTPVAGNIGNHNLTINVYDNDKNLLQTKTINLKVVAKTTSPASNKNILCIGDSLTEGGQWVSELHRRINLSTSQAPDGSTAPTGLGLTNITFVGKRQTANGAGYEGFGGWKFSNYLDTSTSTDDYWVTATHSKTSADQESIWKDANNVQWQLETIEPTRLKFKKYSGAGALPSSGTLTWVSGGSNTDTITYTNASLAAGNPFVYDGQIDFEAYCEDLGITTIDEVYILLAWNSFAQDKATFKAQAKQFIDLLRTFNPSIKVVLMGIQVPAADGLAQNYGANSISSYLNVQKFTFYVNDLYTEIVSEYDSGVSFMNIASQFDTEYCMPTITTTPNTRVSTQISQQSNGVHPANSGYYEIADTVYRWINAKIS